MKTHRTIRCVLHALALVLVFAALAESPAPAEAQDAFGFTVAVRTLTTNLLPTECVGLSESEMCVCACQWSGEANCLAKCG